MQAVLLVVAGPAAGRGASPNLRRYGEGWRGARRSPIASVRSRLANHRVVLGIAHSRPGHTDHDWWELLLTTNGETKIGVNSAEYRVAPATGPRHQRLCGMRHVADTESLKRAARARLLQPTSARLGSTQPNRRGSPRDAGRERLGPARLARRSRPQATEATTRRQINLLNATEPPGEADRHAPSRSRRAATDGRHPPGP